MTVRFQVGAEGQLPNSQTTIYTATSDYEVILSIIITNNNSTAETVRLWLKNGASTARKILHTSLNQNDTLTYEVKMVMELGDILQGQTTTASQVDYWVSISRIDD